MKELTVLIRRAIAEYIDAAENNYALYPKNLEPVARQIKLVLDGRPTTDIIVSTDSFNADLARLKAEKYDAEIRVDRAWEAIKSDLARREWLTQQIIKAEMYAPNTDFNLTPPSEPQVKS